MWWVVPLMVFGHVQFFGVNSHAVPNAFDPIQSSSSDFQKIGLHVAGALRHTINPRASSWTEARRLCNEEKGHLAVINSVNESQAVAELLITASHRQKGSTDSIQAFIGIHDLFQDGNFTTIYGESLAEAGYGEWFVNDTDTADADKRCGAIGGDGKLYKVKCDTTRDFVCEWPADNEKPGRITIETESEDSITTSISTTETTSNTVAEEGKCRHVGCDLMLGSDAKEDNCRECGGDGSACNTLQGLLDMDDLVVGYNDILLIPAGATNIAISEVRPSNNYLAIRNSTGHYYLNGNWRIDEPQSLRFAGSVFHYERRRKELSAADIINALGPINEALYIVLLSQDTNVGVKYEYSIPKRFSHQTKPDGYDWVAGEFSECSTTCGGGTKSKLVRCVRRGDGEEGDAELCDPEFEPQGTQSCGEDPCPPEWEIGEWGPCSKKCGSGGEQTREIKCKQLVARGIISTVDDSQCLEYIRPKDSEIQECNKGVECPQWHIGPWKPCDRLCGAGNQTRKITCYEKVNGKISVMDDSDCPDERPESEKECNLRPCVGVDWVVSAWTGCDFKCGLTRQIRKATCMSLDGEIYPDEQCKSETKPELVTECSAKDICSFQWYATQWSECSSKCGTGIQSRQVFCGTLPSGGDFLTQVEDEKCDADKKYNTTQECTAEADECKGEWFAGPWSECSKECDGGDRTRKVFCMKDDKVVPDEGNCDQEDFMTLSESCNEKPCNEGRITIETVSEDSNATSISTTGTTNKTVVEEDNYIWAVEEFSECNTTCGGGIKSRLVRCVRRGDGEEGDAELCDPEFEPPGTQSCGEDSCPPEWQIGEWGPCSKKCGSGGEQTREIKCKQLVARDIISTVNDSQCVKYIGPKDIEIQECNTGLDDINTENCTNKIIKASGSDFEGGPCHTYQFGCCPDGVSVASGPQNQGCGCENTKFKCCSDGVTPAKGENYAGCTCDASKFGCCPDGVEEAQGENFEGCLTVPITPGAACALDKDRGTCSSFHVRWFFDTEYGGCSRFWYGGCGGNENLFNSQEECKEVCVEPKGRDACFLPKIAGPCEGFDPIWYYDAERKQCGQFIYSGCRGNANRFRTREDCEELCVEPDDVDPCEQDKEVGPCEGNFTRWYFNKQTDSCEEFIYGGCKANKNNFATQISCQQQCLLRPSNSRVPTLETVPAHVETPAEPNIRAQEGGYVVMKCVATGNPRPLITWKKGVTLINNTTSRYIVTDEGSLQIVGLYTVDAGTYTCTVDNNVAAPVTIQYELEITAPHPHVPVIVGDRDYRVTVNLNSSATLECRAWGWPRPVISWWHESRMLPVIDTHYEYQRDYSLKINRVSLVDLGVYTCQAYNGINKPPSWSVTLQAPGPVYDDNPAHQKYLQYLIAPQTRPSPPNVRPPPPYVPPPTAVPMTPKPPTYAPYYPERKPSIPGVIDLSPVIVPNKYTAPAKVNVSVEPGPFPVGSNFSIACEVEGFPDPNVTWFKDDVPIQPDNRISINYGDNKVNRVVVSYAVRSDAGNYRCEAVNQYTKDAKFVDITVEGIYISSPDCQDSPTFANCALIVKGKYCQHDYYVKFCCRSCTEAGQTTTY